MHSNGYSLTQQLYGLGACSLKKKRRPPGRPKKKRGPPGRPKKKRALEPDEPRSHRKNRGVGISKQCKGCGKLGHNRRTCKGKVGGNSSLPGSASQVNRTTRRVSILT